MNGENLIKYHEKEEFYCNLNMEDITDADYMHAKRICKDLKIIIKKKGEYYNLNLKRDTILWADLFESYRKMWKIYRLDPAKFLSAPGLAWQAPLKETEVKLELLTMICL